jgi:hypothetical protein
MEYLIFMTERGAFQKLVHETANGHWIEGASVAVLVHVLFQILFAILKDKDQFRLGMDNVVEANDVNVLELLHERDLTNRR